MNALPTTPMPLIRWCLILTLWGLFAAQSLAMPSPKPQTADPVPGNAIDLYLRRYQGLHQTGGVTARGLKKGEELQIFEGKRGKELTYSPTFLSCDPTDLTGLIYLPRLTLVVLKTPDGHRTVVSEAKTIGFQGPEAIDRFLADNETAALQRTPPAANPIEALKRWYARTFKHEKVYSALYSDRQVKIYQGMLDQGAIGSLLLVPDWNAMPEEVPVNAKPGGTMKRVDYLVRCKRVALDDLYRYTRRRPMH